ncbi:hypothetical protein BH18ACI4_BH18ACI4_06790 [soil metagenome]
MRTKKHHYMPAKLTAIAIVCSFLAGILTTDKTRAQSLLNLNQTTQTLSQLGKISGDLLNQVLGAGPKARVNIIVQSNGPWVPVLDLLITLTGGRITSGYSNFNLRAVDIPAASVLALVLNTQIDYISPDRSVVPTGHLSTTTGANAAATSAGRPDLDGSGIGIAVIDSGIYSAHRSFIGVNSALRVVANKDFTGERRTDDPYGHGTHVAGIAAGNGRISTGAYLGIAPNANLINLRVLNSQGAGTTSGLLSALDWVMTNRSKYNIRVVNMSLGAPAVDSYKNDPICKAVRHLVNKGIVVVVAAGNNGVDASGLKIYGQIHSPGIEPSAITVGAANTYGTDARADDTVTTYSSRGPTRSYWTDGNGTRRYDNLIKPDLVAPGNKLIAAEAVNNLLVTQYPDLDAGVSDVATLKMMRLSGTSMAAPAAAGAAALILQTNGRLTPNLVKAIMMYTAQPLAGYNMLEQGAGQLNIEGAVRLAKLIRTDLTNSTPLGASLLSTTEPPFPETVIADYPFGWSQGVILNYTYVTGKGLATFYQKVYGTGVLLSDGVITSDGVIAGDTMKLTDGIQIGQNIMTSNGVIAGDGQVFCAYGVLLSDTLLRDGQFLGDGVIAGDSTGVIAGDTIRWGDNTSCMESPPDPGN